VQYTFFHYRVFTARQSLFVYREEFLLKLRAGKAEVNTHLMVCWGMAD